MRSSTPASPRGAHDNRITGTNAACAEHNEYGIDGMVVTGSGSVVKHNRIEGMTVSGSAGILVQDYPDSPPATNNLVTANVLTGNLLDIEVTAASNDNVVTGNRCTTSSPQSLCP